MSRSPALAPAAPSPAYALAKRGLDVTAAALLLIVFAPLCLLVAVAIKLDSPGPVIFTPTRLGLRRRRFVMYKFRTMYDNDDPAATTRSVLAATYRKPPLDPRITRLGYWLRRTSLDELPNLVNVLRGEMSLVGPRPCGWDPASFGEAADEIASVKPGMTGLWQVSGRSDLAFADRIRLDRDYVRRQSLWLDLRILARTIPAVLSGRGAY